MKVAVTGKSDLDALARKLRKAAKVDLPRAMDRGLKAAGEVVADEIRGSTDTYMPGGYKQVFAKSLITKVSVRVAGAVRKAELSIRAFGRRGHDRQVDHLEKGRLKHPVFTRKVWVWQKIRAGFASEPAKRATPKAVAALNEAAGQVADAINK